ncbi:uncharacterized protein LOC143229595 [Tachypleus tridentatus]|uniref:uncharacterized protein LOC143229595 n=1 Tax=Tachypleus tridentatus TaxID=6853 RepID=UPI003FD5FC4D
MSRRTRNPSVQNQTTTFPRKFTENVTSSVAEQAQQYLEENVKTWMKPDYEKRQYTLLTDTCSGGDPFRFSELPNTSFTMLRHTPSHLYDHRPMTTSDIHPSDGSNSPFSGHFHGTLVGHNEFVMSRRGQCEDFGKVPEVFSAQTYSLPHSLSYSGCSQSSFLQETSYSSPCGPVMELSRPSVAASFFARATQRLNLTPKKKRRYYGDHESETSVFQTNFTEVIRTCPPPVPPGLQRLTSLRDRVGLGKVKVMLRVSPVLLNAKSSNQTSFLSVDVKKKHVSLYDPTISETTTNLDRNLGVAAPKMFAFDAVFPQESTQTEVVTTALTEVIQSVVNGVDGCLFVYGHTKLGKTYTMIGQSSPIQELGATPCAISWLFKLITEQKEKTGARFSVRASAIELTGRQENLKDLLCNFAVGTDVPANSPSLLLQSDSIYGTHLSNQSEIRAPTAEKASFLLDAALAARSKVENEDEKRNSHFLFTLHVYQYRFEKGNRSGVAGGRSRLSLIDLGSCEKIVKPRDGDVSHGLSVSALGNVIIALFNGQKHVPYKESKLTQLLREVLGSLTCRTVMIAHISSEPEFYSETLSTIQLASRIHRLRRKKWKFPGTNSGENSGEERGRCRPFPRDHAVIEDISRSGSSDPDYTSSSEQSCDTVIFVGERGSALSNNQVTSSLLGRSAKKTTQSCDTNDVPVSEGNENTEKCQHPSYSKHFRSAFPSVTRATLKNPLTNYQASEKNSNVRSVERFRLSKSNAIAVETKTLQTGNRLNGKLQTANSSSINDYTVSLSEHGGISYPTADSQAYRNCTFKQKSQTIKQERKFANICCYNNRELNLQSDELWIDGPRFSKSKFDNRSIQSLHKEQWVDGPGLEFNGHMDEHKKHFITKWVEEHSRHVQQNLKKSEDAVWIDFPMTSSADLDVDNVSQKEGHFSENQNQFDVLGPQNSQNTRGMETVENEFQLIQTFSTEQNKKVLNNFMETVKSPHICSHRCNDTFDSCKEESSMKRRQHQDFESQSLNYKAHHCIQSNDTFSFVGAVRSNEKLKNVYDIEESSNSDEKTRVEEEDEPVEMRDSCIQATEEDIIVSMLKDDSTSTLSQASKTSCGNNSYHPLRVLSKDSLALDSTFTDPQLVDKDKEFSTLADRKDYFLNENGRKYSMEETIIGTKCLSCRKMCAVRNLKLDEKQPSGDECLETISLPGKIFQLTYNDIAAKDLEIKSTQSEPWDVTNLRLQYDNKLATLLWKTSHKPKPVLVVSPILRKTKQKSVSLNGIEDLEMQDLEDSEIQYPLRALSHEVNKKILSYQDSKETALCSKPEETLKPLFKEQTLSNIHNTKGNEYQSFSEILEKSKIAETRSTTCEITKDITKITLSARTSSRSRLIKNEKELEIKPLVSSNFGSCENYFHQNNLKVAKPQDVFNLRVNDFKDKEPGFVSSSDDLQNPSTELSQFNNKEKLNNATRSQKQNKRIKSPFLSYFSRESGISLCLREDNSTRRLSGSVHCGSTSLLQSYSTGSPFMSPYAKITQARSMKSSSGRGSDSSVVSGEPRDGSKLLACGKLLQFSGTSSGYESMMRDSEETPVSSSQESGNEWDSVEQQRKRHKHLDKELGSEKQTKSSTFQHRTTAANLTCQESLHALTNETMTSRHRQDNEWHEEDICCTGLLCCGVSFRKITSDLSYV